MANPLELKVIFSAVDKFVRPVNAITGSARAASNALKESTDRADELNRHLGKIDAFEKVRRDAAIAANTLKSTQSKIEALREEMKNTGGSEAMTREMSRLQEKSAKLTADIDKLRRHEHDLNAALKIAGVDTKNLADARHQLGAASAAASMNSMRLQSALDAENKKMQRLKAAQADLAKSRETAERMRGTGAKLLAGGAAVNAVAAIPVMAYAKAEESATQLKVAMMQSGGVVSEEFKAVNAQAEKLGNKLPGTTADYQDMMTMLIRQGMAAKSILGGLGEATAYLSVQLKMAPTAAAEFASKLQDATRTADKDMMGLMDTIQKTFFLGVDQNNMLSGFSKLSPALSILRKEGLGAANALAPLLVMTDQSGMAGEAAGNAFRKIFQLSMDAKKLGKGNAALSGTGIKLDFSDGKGEFGGIDKMYQQLEKLKGVNTRQRLTALKAIFGDDAETLQALTIMIDKGVGGYREVQAKMNAQATLQERVNLQLKTLTKLWDAASGTFTNALVTFGESISPELHATAEWMGKIAERTQAWAKENPELAATIMTVAKWTGMALLGIGGLVMGLSAIAVPIAMAKFALVTLGISGTAAGAGAAAAGAGVAASGASMAATGGIFARVGAGIRAIGSAILWVGRAMLMTPIGIAVTLIAIAALTIYKYWEPISKFFSELWEDIKTKFDDAVAWISKAGSYIADGFLGGLNKGWERIKERLRGNARELTDPVTGELEIHSPSRVFERLGIYTMQGFEQGLQGGADGPLSAVGDLAKKLAGIGAGVVLSGAAGAADLKLDTRPPLTPAAMMAQAAGAAPMQVVINIYGAPGQNTGDIQRQVERALQNIEARRASQRRSALRDPD